MSVLDLRADQINAINQQLSNAPTFGDYLRLQYEKYQLQVGLQAARTVMTRLSQGWAFTTGRKPTA